MKGIYKVILLFSAMLLAPGLSAQAQVTAVSAEYLELPIEQLSINQGLSAGLIAGMVQDHNGYIWAATGDGLNRYDGTMVKVFRHNPNDSLSIADNSCRYVFEDSKNRLWVATANGLDLYEPRNESFIHFRHQPQNPKSIAVNTPGFIFQGADNSLIINTGASYDIMSEKPGTHADIRDAFEFSRINEVYPALKKTWDTKHNDDFLPLHYFNNEFWCNDSDSLYRFTDAGLSVNERPQAFAYRLSESVGFTFITSPDKKDIYITSYEKVLKKFDPVSHTFIPVLQLPGNYSFKEAVYIDNNNRLWAIQPDNNMIRINLDTRKITDIHLKWGDVDPNITRMMWFGLQDNFNNMWLGTAGVGMYKISHKQELFKRVTEKRRFGNYLWYHRIEQAGQKAGFDKQLLDKWLATVYKINFWGKGLAISNHHVAFAYDKKGYFWSFYFNPKTMKNTIVKVNPETATYEEIASRHGEATEYFGVPIFIDNHGEAWAGGHLDTAGLELYHFPSSGSKEEIFTFPVKSHKGAWFFIYDHLQDPDDLMWLGTMQGLFTFHPATKKWQQFVHVPGDTNTLSSDHVLSICVDPAEPLRYIWVGTDSGLDKFDRNTQAFTHYTISNGLPHNAICGVQSDKHNNLWLSTGNGLCLFNPRTAAARNFTVEDGLAGNEFNAYQFSKTVDGTLYFGSTDGINYFQPEDFYTEEAPSPVIINGLKLRNKPVNFSRFFNPDDGYHLPAPIEQCKELVFKYDERMITLGFALNDLTIPHKNRFRYMLEGLDNNWIEAGTSNEAIYTNLSPGNYTFKVIGCNSNNVWSTTPTTLLITILPPWWATWWFRLIIICAVAGLLYALYYYRLQQLLHMERMRNRIAQDLHDEIGSTLSSISLYSAAMKKTKTEKDKDTILDKIIESTSEIMESMNDIVWTIKADNDNFENVVNRMRAFAVKMTEVNNIKLTFDAGEHIGNIKLGLERRKNIYLIFKEAVNNAVKYSGCSNMNITVGEEQNRLKMEIHDNGSGFDLAAALDGSANLGGNGLRGMQVRAKEMGAQLNITSRPGTGTTITLLF